MRAAHLVALCCAVFVTNLPAQDFLDQVGETLSFQAFDNNFRARLSGTLDLEYYVYDAEFPPGLIDAEPRPPSPMRKAARSSTRGSPSSSTRKPGRTSTSSHRRGSIEDSIRPTKASKFARMNTRCASRRGRTDASPFRSASLPR
jgi:hypothetical protein